MVDFLKIYYIDEKLKIVILSLNFHRIFWVEAILLMEFQSMLERALSVTKNILTLSE